MFNLEDTSQCPNAVGLDLVNGDICDAIYEALRLVDGRFRSPEALLSGACTKIVVQEICVGVKDKAGFIAQANAVFERRGLDAKASYLPVTDRGIVAYLGGAYTIEIKFDELNRSDDAAIAWGDSGEQMSGSAPERIMEDLASTIAKQHKAYELVCFVEIFNKYKERLAEMEGPVIEECRRAIMSVQDFGMAISLDFTQDARLLPDLDISRYITRFGQIASMEVHTPEDVSTADTTDLFGQTE